MTLREVVTAAGCSQLLAAIRVGCVLATKQQSCFMVMWGDCLGLCELHLDLG